MVHTYSNAGKIYSVDLMMAYVNIYKPKKLLLDCNLDEFLATFEYNGWGDGKTRYSPRKVMNNPKKYKDEYQRILDADLKYPIIIDYHHGVVDGVHRIAKSYLLGKKNIKAYVFDRQLMNKFLIKNSQLESYELIELFNRRFDCSCAQ